MEIEASRATTLLFGFSVLLVAPRLLAQHWAPTGLPGESSGVYQVYTDTAHDALYVAGELSLSSSNQALFRYSQGQWDTLQGFSHALQTVVVFHDTVIVAGAFTTVNFGDTVRGIAYFDGALWKSYGHFHGSVTRLRVLDDTLYAVGSFDQVDGHSCQSVAKRVGSDWQDLGSLGASSQPLLSDITLFQGRPVVTGQIHFQEGNYADIMIYDGTTWDPVGPFGLLGWDAGGSALCIYNGDLIVGGKMGVLDGNAGHGIMRWDGEEWHGLGTGLTIAPDNYDYLTGAYDLMVHDGLLYAAGGFWYAGNVPASSIATWDGQRWCGLGGSLDPICHSLAFYQDTLFVGVFHNADGEPVNCLAKYIGNYPDTCSVLFTSIDQSVGLLNDFTIMLEPGEIRVGFDSGQQHEGRLFDATGRLLASRFGSAFEFPTTGLPSGVYLVRIAGFRPRRVFVP